MSDAKLRCFNDLVILRPREDLEQSWNSSTIITPDSALVGPETLSPGYADDHTAIAEVYRMPKDYRSADLKVGDGVLLPLFNGSKVVFIDREPYLAVKRRGIAARIENLGMPSEKITALNGYILTRRDREAFEKHMHGGLPFPDEFLDSGMPCDAGDSIVRMVLERIVSTGTTFLSPTLQRPKQRVGDLAFLNPIAACKFRRFGQVYRLTPENHVSFTLEE